MSDYDIFCLLWNECEGGHLFSNDFLEFFENTPRKREKLLSYLQVWVQLGNASMIRMIDAIRLPTLQDTHAALKRI